MRTLGIDPGTLHMGLGVVDSQEGRLTLAHLGVLSASRSKPLAERLRCLYEGLLEYIAEWQPSVAAIEEPFVARNVRSAMAVGQAQAVAMLAAASRGLPVHTYSPREVKQAVTDYGGSSKEQVQEMVRVLLGLPETPRPADAADALAVAICHINASHVHGLTILE